MTPLTPQQQVLAAKFFKAAVILARSRAARCPRLIHDLESAAGLIACQAARSWKPEFGCPFGAYANAAVRVRLCNVFRADRPRGYRNRDGSCRVVGRESFDEQPEPVAPDWVSELDELDAFETRIAPLPARDQRVLRMAFLEGLNNKEMGERLGLSGERARQLCGGAVRTLGGARVAASA